MRLAILLTFALVAAGCGGSSTRTNKDGANGGNGGTGGDVSGGSSQSGTSGAGQAGSPVGGTGPGPTGGSGGAAGEAGAPSGGGRGGMGGMGGSSPSGGASGSSASGGSASISMAECRTNEDCRLSEDCCNCYAAGPGEALTTCRRACTPTTTACALENVTADDVYCSFGRCVLARHCDLRYVTCDVVEPECPAGMVPSVIGSCYGPCTTISECASVASCGVCEAAGLACVSVVDVGGRSARCVTTPAACADNPTCACMGVCEGPFFCADGESTNLDCYCPTC